MTSCGATATVVKFQRGFLTIMAGALQQSLSRQHPAFKDLNTTNYPAL